MTDSIVPYETEVRAAIEEVGEYRARRPRPPTLGITSEALLATLAVYLEDPASVDPRDIRLLERGIEEIGQWRIEIYGEDVFHDVRRRRLDLLRRIRAVLEARNTSQIAIEMSQDLGQVPGGGTYALAPDAQVSGAVTTDELRLREIKGANIRLARRTMEPPLSQRQLASAIDMGDHRARISEYEHGLITPTDGRLQKIADVTGRSVGWFYEPHEDDA